MKTNRLRIRPLENVLVPAGNLLCLTLIAMAAMAGVLCAQRPEGAIEGRVMDSSESVIPGAAVQVKGPSGFARTVTTDATGKFTVNGLASGSYSIQVDWPGFAPFRSEPLDVSGGRPRIFNVKLKLSDIRQQVTVEADGFQPVSVSAESNASAIIVTGTDLESMADDPDELLAELQALAGPAVTPEGGQTFIDGFSGGRLPSKESIREIRINQNPFAAEYDLPGFGRIEVFTKPGTNKFHGLALLKFRDAALDSRNPFSATKPPYRSRDFEGNVEGPLWSRASFFANVERRRIDQSAIVDAVGLDDSLSVIRLNQAIPNPQWHTTISPRVDYQFNDANTLTVRYAWMDMRQQNAGTGGFSLFSRRHSTAESDHTIQLTENAVLNKSVINETRFQYIRRDLRLNGDNTLPAVTVLGSFLGGGAQVGLSKDVRDHYEFQNYTSMLRGNHSIRFGGRLRVLSLADSSTQNFGGTFTFGGEMAPLLDLNHQPIPDSGGQPLLGYISSLERYQRTLLFQREGLNPAQIRALGGGASQFSIVGGDPLAKVLQADTGIFAQDDWRARPNLSLSFGLRYEAQSNIARKAGFAPRFGFAWEPNASGRKKYHTVIRGGSGIFYDRVDAALTLQALRFDGIHRQQFIIRDPPLFPQVPSIPDLAAQKIPETLRGMDTGLRSPYSIVSSIGVERDLPLRVKIASTFTHTHAVHLLLSQNIKSSLPNASSGRGVAPNIYQYQSAGVLNGNQIITNVSRGFGGRLSLYGYYAYSRIFSNTDGPNTFPASRFDLKQEYGRAATDIRHRFVFGGSFYGPWGYVLSPFVVGRSGASFNITTGRDTNADSVFSERPALANDPSGPGVMVTKFGAFDPNPSPGTPLIPRNYGGGPALFMLNLRLNKTIGLGRNGNGLEAKRRSPKKRRDSESGAKVDENDYSSIFHTEKSDQRFNLTFSVTAWNLFNNLNPGIPVGDLSSPAFGTSNWLASSGNPYHPSYGNNRTVQLELRLGF